MQIEGTIILWGVRVLLLLVITPIVILVAGHLAGVEKASILRAVTISVFGLFLLVLLMIPIAAKLVKTLNIATPIPIPFVPIIGNLDPLALIAIYLVSFILLIKIGFESTFIDAFTVGMSSAVILLMAAAIILFLTSIPFGTG